MTTDAKGDAAPSSPQPGLRIVRSNDPFKALGLAVNHLMSKPAYATMKFSAWCKILTGQINRGHYRFVVDERAVVGMLGWAYTDKAVAERWVRGEPTDAFTGKGGDAVLFNLWSADTPEVTPLLLDAARAASLPCEMIYFRRLYADGRLRPVRLTSNQFISAHVARRSQAFATMAP